MKKAVSISLCVLMLLAALCGCRNGNVSDKYYDLTLKVIEKTDEYLDYENMDTEAIAEEISIMADSYPEDNGSLEETVIPMTVSYLGVEFGMIDSGFERYDDILALRNELAEYIGVAVKK